MMLKIVKQIRYTLLKFIEFAADIALFCLLLLWTFDPEYIESISTNSMIVIAILIITAYDKK